MVIPEHELARDKKKIRNLEYSFGKQIWTGVEVHIKQMKTANHM